MLIDSHVNLHAPAFDLDREAVIARARSAGVGAMITICDRLDRFAAVQGIAERTRTSGAPWERTRMKRRIIRTLRPKP